MVTKHKRKSWKGHCWMCARAKGKYLGNQAKGVPWAVRRQLGAKRRLKRSWVS